VPAPLAGAAVAIKPSELTPLTTREIARCWREDVGAPGVLECLTGAGGTGSALVDEADFIQFTGSTRTGRKIAQRAAERLIPYSLELGGKDAMIVLADADIERAANAAVWGGMFNSGQTCTSVERVFVEEPVYDEFVEFVAGRVRGLRQRAAGKRFDADIGSLPARRSSPSLSGTCPRRWRTAHVQSSAASARTRRGRSSSPPCSWTSISR
jgi:acyl-CoA reductase-like NAD-dependent aldehyde dehydrogenase